MQYSAPRHLEISSTPTVRAKAACGRRPRSRSYWHRRCHNTSKDETPDSVEGHTSPQMHARTGSRQGSVYMSQGVPICNCHPPRRQTMRQGGSLQLCCGAAHTESTCYTACIHIRFWPLHGPLTGLGSSAAVQTVANRRSRRCGRAGVMVQVWSLGKRGVGLRRVVRCGGGSARSGFTCRALGLRQCCGSGSACC